MEKPQRLSMECESIDKLLGGGVEHGIITNVFGGAGSGKTNFCVQAIASCIQDGGRAVFIDTEGGFSAERYLQMHDDEDALEDIILYEPTTFEEQKQIFDEIPQTVAEEAVDIIVVDSLVSLYRLNLNGENAQEINNELSRQFSTLSKMARKHDIPVIVTNQVYSQFDTEENVMVGRDIPAYWSKTLIELEKVKNSKRRAVLQKHRSRPEGLIAEFYITEESLTSENGDEANKMKIF